jgi:hypothetical protein
MFNAATVQAQSAIARDHKGSLTARETKLITIHADSKLTAIEII